jgi:hypothetical protein
METHQRKDERGEANHADAARGEGSMQYLKLRTEFQWYQGQMLVRDYP